MISIQFIIYCITIYFNHIFLDKIGKDFSWPDNAVHLLLELYREREEEFLSGFKRHNILWTEMQKL